MSRVVLRGVWVVPALSKDLHETTKNARIRWYKHEDPKKKSKSLKHIGNHPLVIHFTGKPYCLPQLIITSHKLWKCQ